MADVDTLPVGSFCWPELSTSDQNSGVAFYRTLFGWNVNEMSMGPDGVYSMFEMRGRPVGAAAGQRPEERQQGIPPHWNTYITVENADAAVERARRLGGAVLAPAFDVADAGRMAVLADPTGAAFQVWQPGKHIGTRIQREAGALCWTELVTNDTGAAERFYTQFFGWTTKKGGTGADEYTEFNVSGVPSGGMMAIRPEWGPHIPPNWTPYFQVTDCDGAAAKAKSLGAQVGVPPSRHSEHRQVRDARRSAGCQVRRVSAEMRRGAGLRKPCATLPRVIASTGRCSRGRDRSRFRRSNTPAAPRSRRGAFCRGGSTRTCHPPRTPRCRTTRSDPDP